MAATIVGLDVVWIQRHRRRKGGEGLLELPVDPKCNAEIDVGLGAVWPQLDRLRGDGDALIILTLPYERNTEVEVATKSVWIQLDGLSAGGEGRGPIDVTDFNIPAAVDIKSRRRALKWNWVPWMALGC